MPLTLPDLLPAIELLKQENIFVLDHTPPVVRRWSGTQPQSKSTWTQ